MPKIELTCAAPAMKLEAIPKVKRKKVFFQGSFDLFHYGHLLAIIKAKGIAEHVGGTLIVGVNTDKLYREYKEREPVIPFKYRRKMIESLKYVDKVIPAPEFSPLQILKDYDIDIYVVCAEWKGTKDEEMKYMREKGGEVVILPYLKSISSSELKLKMIDNYLKHNLKMCPQCHKQL